MLPILQGRTVLVTGGSGFLGTVLVTQLLSYTSIKACYIVVRGGREKLLAKWANSLPSDILEKLSRSSVIRAVDGDITLPHLGLKDQYLAEIRQEVEVIVHSASSINLAASMQELLPSIVYGTLRVVDLAMQCQKLEKFVYISTAYVNANLHMYHNGVETPVNESIYLPKNFSEPELDLAQIEKDGYCTSYPLNDFPYGYSCAKHLTERLVIRKFCKNQDNFISRGTEFEGSFQKWSEKDLDFPKDLLIIRPAVLGPSLWRPYPNFEVIGSAPLTSFAALAVMTMSPDIVISSRLSFPLESSTVNEVPVDIVCNRIIMHVYKRSCGIVHAVASKNARLPFKDLFEQIRRLRQPTYGLHFTSINESWHSKRQHKISQIYKILDTSYDFKDDTTKRLSGELSNEENKMLGIIYDASVLLPSFLSDVRIQQVKRQIQASLGRNKIPDYLENPVWNGRADRKVKL